MPASSAYTTSCWHPDRSIPPHIQLNPSFGWGPHHYVWRIWGGGLWAFAWALYGWWGGRMTDDLQGDRSCLVMKVIWWRFLRSSDWERIFVWLSVDAKWRFNLMWWLTAGNGGEWWWRLPDCVIFVCNWCFLVEGTGIESINHQSYPNQFENTQKTPSEKMVAVRLYGTHWLVSRASRVKWVRELI
jgi:hypothetical protein